MLNYAMTYPGKFPPKFELSNSSHARKAEESFAMHTIVQSEWSGGTARKVSLHISKILAYRQNIYPRPPSPLPHPLFSPTTSHISPVSSFLPSLLSYSRFLALAVSHPTAGVAMVFFKDLSSGSSSDDDSLTTRVCLSSLSRAMTWNEGFLPGGRFESFLPLVAP